MTASILEGFEKWADSIDFREYRTLELVRMAWVASRTVLCVGLPAEDTHIDYLVLPRELLGRVLDPETGEEWSKALRELRALLALQKVKSQ